MMAWRYWRFAVFACASVVAATAPAPGSVVVYTLDVPNSIVDEFNDEPAAFGAKLPAEGLRGMMVKGGPVDGCSALAPPPDKFDSFDKWIALISRYNCTFGVKIRNAQAAGFDAVIVHNVNSSELETMSAKYTAGINIPSVFVSDLTGLALEEFYLYNSGYFIMLQNEPPTGKGNLILLIGILVAVLVVFIVCFYLIWMRSTDPQLA